MADFPGSLPSLDTGLANETEAEDTHPAHHNAVADEVNAIAAELGTDPAGSEATVAARIAAAESDIGDKADSSALTAHASDSTSVHGIADTSDLVLDDDARLSDDRDPTAHAASHASGQADEIEPGDIGAASASSISASGLGVAVHGSTTAAARPSGFAQVLWIGTVEPDNMVDDDLWVDPS